MKLIIQRVKSTSLSVDNKLISQIDKGLAVYIGIFKNDTKEQAIILAKKLVKLRIFEDENGKMNKSILDIGGQIIAISQFTLCADTVGGNRPSFTNAEIPQLAKSLYEYFVELLNSLGVVTKMGVFGADMQILQHNDGPATFIL